MRYLCLILFFIFLNSFVFSQNVRQKRSYSGQKIKTEAPKIDGDLTDVVWSSANWEGDFIQHTPNEGNQASQKTEFAILYDDNFLYVAIKAYDNNPDSIVRRMTRRDNVDGDHVAIQFDSYFDKRTAFTFLVSVAGVKGDFLVSNDGESEDETWNPIWWVETAIDAKGWTAEMKIPFTQLRFSKSDEQKWGLQVARILFRKDEMSIWQDISREASGWVSHLGTFDGLDIKPQKQFDITPYFTSSIETYEADAENPYLDGQDTRFKTGVDGKIGLTNNFTLDFTINPDFGQVEADPSEVNLTAYESFFSEQRPFFVEGRNILSYPLMFGDGDLAAENLFYSRRIGRSPHHYPDLLDNEYADVPNNTSIIGALKLTGKTTKGWSIGVMESVTSEEKAKIMYDREERTETVEPLTNYFVTRVQRDINKGNTLIGAVLTGVNRSINDEHLDFLHTNAYTGGLDFSQYFKDKTYFLKLNTYWSNVQGSTWAISETQNSSARYFQREDATYLNYDSTRTSLTGSGGNIQIGKQAGKFMFMLSGSMKSPSLEVNDIGYLQAVDDIMQIFWMGYRVNKPFSIFRSVSLNFNQWSGWDFGGNHTYTGGNINAHTQFKNYWEFGFGSNINGQQISNNTLWGGPSMILPGSKNLWFYVETNNQKKLSMWFNSSFNKAFEESYRKSSSYYFGITYRPTSTLRISLSPNFSVSDRELQYITETEYLDDARYLFASLKQKMTGMSIRINYNITPVLSIQYWGQPFIAAGDYSNYKYITNPHADKYSDRFIEYNDSQMSYDAENYLFTIDENNTGLDTYSFDSPEFNVKEFLSNMVVKWEYRPGSTIYFVWSQSKSDYIQDGSFMFKNDLNNLFDVKARNVFLIKFSYRIGL